MPPPPEGLLPEKALSVILADVLLLEAQVNRYGSVLEGFGQEMMWLHQYPAINEKYGLADSQLYHSYQYYTSDPEAIVRIMTGVIDTLNTLDNILANQADSVPLPDH